jgi:hypothetical protein
LEKAVLPFLKKRRLVVSAVLTSDADIYCGRDDHPLQQCFHKHRVRHKIRSVAAPGGGGFIERFIGAVQDEFVKGLAAKQNYRNVKQLKLDFFEWRKIYNAAPLAGFPSYGASPFDMLKI